MQSRQTGNQTKQRMSAFDRWPADWDEIQITVNTTGHFNSLDEKGNPNILAHFFETPRVLTTNRVAVTPPFLWTPK